MFAFTLLKISVAQCCEAGDALFGWSRSWAALAPAQTTLIFEDEISKDEVCCAKILQKKPSDNKGVCRIQWVESPKKRLRWDQLVWSYAALKSTPKKCIDFSEEKVTSAMFEMRSASVKLCCTKIDTEKVYRIQWGENYLGHVWDEIS